MAIKDIFNNFFTFEDEEEMVYEKEVKQPQQPKQTPRQTTQQVNTEVERQRVIRSKQPEKNNLKVAEKKVMPNQNIVNIEQDYASSSSKVCLFEPRVFSDTQDIADELKRRRATLVNLQRIDKLSAKRIIDFLSGTVYAIGGDIQKVGSDIFLCTPDNVEVAGSITEMIEAPEDMEYQD